MRLGARLQLLSLSIVAIVIVAIVTLQAEVTLRSIALPGAIAAIAALTVATLFARMLRTDIYRLRDVTQSLARGNLAARPPLTAPGELGELSTSVHRLAEYLESRIDALKSEDALLGALIEALDQGVVAVDARRQVIRINTAARSILGLADSLPFPVDSLPRVPQLQHALDEAMKGMVTEPAEAVVKASTVSLTARPLALGGAVIALFDLTRLRRLEAVRRDFVANVSHELRTPLTVISGFAETLADDDLPAETRKQFAETIHAHTERMKRIVDDLLDLSRLESGRWAPAIADLDLPAIAGEVLGIYRDATNAKALTLDLRLDPSASSISADRTAVRQILSNLTDNAVRHTERGTVTIFSRRSPDGIQIGVSDTGAGIAPEHLARIFERFYRVDSSRGRHTGGTGLGLAIVKHLIEAHGGTVSAASSPGEGTTISAFFPLRINPHQEVQ